MEGTMKRIAILSVLLGIAASGVWAVPQALSVKAITDQGSADGLHPAEYLTDQKWETAFRAAEGATQAWVIVDLESARRKAYSVVGRIRFEGMQYRRDIGTAHLNREPQWPIK